MATSAGESDGGSEHSIEINGTHDMKCAKCFKNGEENGAVGICKECKYYLCSQCVEDHRKDQLYKQHIIAFFYCETTLKANKLVRANSFCLDCGHYLCQKCRLDHGGFRKYRHHTFIGGKTLPGDLFQHEMTRHNVLSSRCSRKTVSGIARRPIKEIWTKSPYLSMVGNTLVNVPKKRTVSVDERVVQRVVQKPRTLIYSTTGRKPRDITLKTPDDENKHRTKARSVHYEVDKPADKADLVGEYDLKGQTDKDKCQIIASVFLENDKLVVADQGNKNVKLYDAQFTYKSSMNLTNFPVALCPSKHVISELFASSGNKLFLIGTHQALTLIRTIDTDAPKIEGLSTWEFGIAIVFKSMRSRSDRKGHLEVHLMTYDGEIKYEITISSQCSVRMVTPIWYITTSNDGSELILSDTNLNRIISIDISNWHVVYVLHGKVKGGAPRSLAMDPDGNLLVSWYGEVHKISQFGKDLGVPVSDIDKQSIIVYNQRSKNLVVHSWTKTQPDRFRVYRLD